MRRGSIGVSVARPEEATSRSSAAQQGEELACDRSDDGGSETGRNLPSRIDLNRPDFEHSSPLRRRFAQHHVLARPRRRPAVAECYNQSDVVHTLASWQIYSTLASAEPFVVRELRLMPLPDTRSVPRVAIRRSRLPSFSLGPRVRNLPFFVPRLLVPPREISLVLRIFRSGWFGRGVHWLL